MGLISFLLMLGISLMLDGAVRPRRGASKRRLRSRQGVLLHVTVMTVSFGLFLAVSGSAPVAGVLAIALLALFAIASNAKYAMLGEPLLFSDLALFAALVRHPGFYLTALSGRQKAGFCLAALGLLLALAWLFVPHATPHLVGIVSSLSAAAILVILLRRAASATSMRTPDIDVDLERHGLIATLLVYWVRWRETPDPPACQPDGSGSVAQKDGAPPELILVVQCESFADPVELTGDPRLALPELARARASAWQWGSLGVSGFGAYTMRTEYGVLFGRSEAELGFRRYDPFLTARSEASYALSARFGASGYRCVFVHPHDLRFYARDRLMPAIGFDQLVGEDGFAAVTPGTGRYISDRSVGEALHGLIDDAVVPTFLYVVTMENHGPWMKDRLTGSPGGLDAYLHHVRNSDAMLADLIDHLVGAGRSALLVFFGDHRPSIPGVVDPGGARHTPYVMMRVSKDGAIVPHDDRQVDLSPDQLHHAILRAARIGQRE